MTDILRSLIAAGKVPLYLDRRTGSLKDLSGSGNDPVVANCADVKTRLGRGLDLGSATAEITCADAASLRLSTLSIVSLMDNGNLNQTSGALTQNPRILSMSNATFSDVNYGLYWDYVALPNNLVFQTGAPATPASNSKISWTQAQWRTTRSVGVTWNSGSAPLFFANESALGAGNYSLTRVPVVGQTVKVGWTLASINYCLRGWNAGLIVNEPLSDFDMCRLMRELTAAPGIVARARKSFSIPYPSKSPAEYAAEGTIVDFPPQVQNGVMSELANGYDCSIGGVQHDIVLDGPFSQSVHAPGVKGGATAVVAYGGATELTISGWVRKYANAASVLVESSTNYSINNGTWLIATDIANANSFEVAFRFGGVIVQVRTPSNSLPNGKWQHFAVTYNATTGVPRIYFDGTEPTPTVVGSSSGPMTDQSLYLLARSLTTLPIRVNLAGLKVQTVALSPADARKEYLEGARKCLLDARVHSDGSCPVTLAASGAGSEIANGWKVSSGTWNVVEDVPSGGRAGERWLKAQAAATVSIRCNPQAFGSWWGKIRFNGVEQEWLFVATNETSVSAATQNGYGIHVTAGGVLTLRERVAGAAAAILTPGVVLANGTEYEFWPTRRADGLFDLNIKGGAYADWTSLGTVTDTTTVQGGYQVLHGAGANAEFRGAMAFLGEMTPAEATVRGLIDP